MTMLSLTQKPSLHPRPARTRGVRCTAYVIGTELVPEIPSSKWTARVLQNPRPVMVHFFADINLPDRCLEMAPVIGEVVRKYAGKLDAWILAYNTNPVGLKYKTRGFPAVAFFVGGKAEKIVHPLQCAPPEGLELAYDELCRVAEEMIALSDAVVATSEPQSA